MTSYSLSVYRGDSYRWRFVLWADADKTDPADLTGVAVASWIMVGGPPIMMGGNIIPLAVTVTDNQIDLVLTAAQSAALPVASGRWDLQLTYPSGDVRTIVAGSVSMRADVTGATVAA